MKQRPEKAIAVWLRTCIGSPSPEPALALRCSELMIPLAALGTRCRDVRVTYSGLALS